MNGWASKNADDLFNVLTRLGGYEPGRLMLEINKRSRSERVNVTTVENAAQVMLNEQHAQDAIGLAIGALSLEEVQ